MVGLGWGSLGGERLIGTRSSTYPDVCHLCTHRTSNPIFNKLTRYQRHCTGHITIEGRSFVSGQYHLVVNLTSRVLLTSAGSKLRKLRTWTNILHEPRFRSIPRCRKFSSTLCPQSFSKHFSSICRVLRDSKLGPSGEKELPDASELMPLGEKGLSDVCAIVLGYKIREQ